MRLSLRTTSFIALVVVLLATFTSTYAVVTNNVEFTRLHRTNPAATFLVSSNAVAVAPNSNVAVAGMTAGALNGETFLGGDRDGFLSLWNSTGHRQWTSLIGTSDFDSLTTVAFPSNNEIFVGGVVADESVFLGKYDGEGSEVWTTTFLNSASASAHALAVNSEGDIIVVGQTRGGTGNPGFGVTSSMFISKRSSTDGSEVWTKLLGTLYSDVGNDVVLDSSDNIYVVGTSGGAFVSGGDKPGENDIVVVKLDTDGDEVWKKIYGSSQNDEGRGISIDSSGNLYITGTYSAGNMDLGGTSSVSHAGEGDGLLLKLDTNGDPVWYQSFGTNETDALNDVFVSGNDVFVVGDSSGDLEGNTNKQMGSADILVARYTTDGTNIWTRLFGSVPIDPNNAKNEQAFGVVVDAAEGVAYIVGDTTGDLGGEFNVGVTEGFLTRWSSAECCEDATTFACGTVVTPFADDGFCPETCDSGTICPSGDECVSDVCEEIICCTDVSTVACGSTITPHPDVTCPDSCDPGTMCSGGFECNGTAGVCEAIECCADPSTVTCNEEVTRHPDATCVDDCVKGSMCSFGEVCTDLNDTLSVCEDITCCQDPSNITCGTPITKFDDPFCSSDCQAGMMCDTGEECVEGECVDIVCCESAGDIPCNDVITRHPSSFCDGVTCPDTTGTQCESGSTCGVGGCSEITCCTASSNVDCGTPIERFPDPFCSSDCGKGDRCTTSGEFCIDDSCQVPVCCPDASTITCGDSIPSGSHSSCSGSCPGVGSMCSSGSTCSNDTCVALVCCEAASTVACGTPITPHPDAQCSGVTCSTGSYCSKKGATCESDGTCKSPSSSGSSVSLGLIAGASAGGVLFLGLLVLLFIKMKPNRDKKKKEDEYKYDRDGDKVKRKKKGDHDTGAMASGSSTAQLNDIHEVAGDDDFVAFSVNDEVDDEETRPESIELKTRLSRKQKASASASQQDLIGGVGASSSVMAFKEDKSKSAAAVIAEEKKKEKNEKKEKKKEKVREEEKSVEPLRSPSEDLLVGLEDDLDDDDIEIGDDDDIEISGDDIEDGGVGEPGAGERKEKEEEPFATCDRPGCGKVESSGYRFNACGQCRRVKYCSTACQHSDWKQHKKQCKVWAAEN